MLTVLDTTLGRMLFDLAQPSTLPTGVYSSQEFCAQCGGASALHDRAAPGVRAQQPQRSHATLKHAAQSIFVYCECICRGRTATA